MKIHKLISAADLVTLLNLSSGLLSILASFSKNFKMAAAFILLSAIFDILDGRIARHFKENSNFGRELDSLSDIVSFGVAPAVIGYAIYPTIVMLIAGFILLFCGALRLARYNISKLDYYEGLPITTTAYIVFILVYAKMPMPVFAIAYLIIGALMISNFRLRL